MEARALSIVSLLAGGCAQQAVPPAPPQVVERVVVQQAPPVIVEKAIIKQAPPRVIEKVVVKEVPASPPILGDRPKPGPAKKREASAPAARKTAVKARCQGLSHVECGKRAECGWTQKHQRAGHPVDAYCHLKPKR